MQVELNHKWLKTQFMECAYVKDAQKGYVVVPAFNLAIKNQVLQVASRAWAQEYQSRQIDAIVGLPDAGSRLVSVLAGLLKIEEILPSKRASVLPGAWQDVVSYRNPSFTTGQDDVLSHIGFVQSGTQVLVVDDVVARGDTAIAAIQALQKAGVTVVGLAVLFDKKWQGGVERIKQVVGVDTYSLISIKSISPEKEINL